VGSGDFTMSSGQGLESHEFHLAETRSDPNLREARDVTEDPICNTSSGSLKFDPLVISQKLVEILGKV
jgi:hypothetical protein